MNEHCNFFYQKLIIFSELTIEFSIDVCFFEKKIAKNSIEKTATSKNW